MQGSEEKKQPINSTLRPRRFQPLGIRAAFLFTNFFLIILALYQLKPASRSLFIESLGADRLPFVWIGTAVIMGGLISFYHRMVEKYPPIRVVFGSCLVFSAMLILFRFWLDASPAAASAGLFVFVDILGVVLVEQFWSLTNSIYSTKEGKGWYGFIGTGGLLGGVSGGALAALLIKKTSLQTPDLVLVAAAIILLLVLLTALMGHKGMYSTVEDKGQAVHYQGGIRAILANRYLMLIAAIILLAQLVSPLIEYQFLKTVEGSFLEREARTAFLSMFFSLLGMVSIGVNLLLTPLIHRCFGAIAGLLIQPLSIALCSLAFLFTPSLFWGGGLKISDRGLSYSINRASKELLYIPIDTVMIYQAKAWIDMFGYRLFKILGSIVILGWTRWLPDTPSVSQIGWINLGICLMWLVVILAMRREYIKLKVQP